MPRTYRKNKNPRRRKLVRRATRVPRRLPTGKVMNFKRSRYEVIQVGTPSGGWLLNSSSTTYAKTFDFQLGDLSDNSDFVNLFKYYKINGVAVKIWPCITTTAADPTTLFNNQMMLRYDINNDGLTGGNGNIDNYIQSQTSKVRRIISGQGNPIRLYMKCKQSNMIYEGSSSIGSTAYTLKKPAWISTTEPTASHYGLNMCIHRMDESGFAPIGSQIKLRLEYTYYISCKKVQ